MIPQIGASNGNHIGCPTTTRLSRNGAAAEVTTRSTARGNPAEVPIVPAYPSVRTRKKIGQCLAMASYLPFRSIQLSLLRFEFNLARGGALGAIDGSVTPNSAYYIEPIGELGKSNGAWTKIARLFRWHYRYRNTRQRFVPADYKNAPRYQVLRADARRPDLASAEIVPPQGEAVVSNNQTCTGRALCSTVGRRCRRDAAFPMGNTRKCSQYHCQSKPRRLFKKPARRPTLAGHPSLSHFLDQSFQDIFV